MQPKSLPQGRLPRQAVVGVIACHRIPVSRCSSRNVSAQCGFKNVGNISMQSLSKSVMRGEGLHLVVRPGIHGRRPNNRTALLTQAMVNVDVSPSVILGVGLIGSGVSLWQIRQAKPWISKDYDVVVSCIALLVGGILIFQVCYKLDTLCVYGFNISHNKALFLSLLIHLSLSLSACRRDGVSILFCSLVSS